MNIALINFGNNKILQNASKIFSKKLYEKGNIVKEINANVDKTPLVGFQYVIFFVNSGSFFAPNSYETLRKFLKEHDNINSNYASIYINKRIFANKHLLRYMALLENFGIIINGSGIIDSEKSAEEFIADFTPTRLGI